MISVFDDITATGFTRIGGRMPRAIFGAGQQSLRSGGPGGAGCQLPRPSAELSGRLFSGRAGTDQIILMPVPNVPALRYGPLGLLRTGGLF
jgi:hypothetical protein